MDLWRISDYHSLSGEGGLEAAARWNSAEFPIVYLADSPASAIVEVLVHLNLERDEIPARCTLLRVRPATEMRVVEISVSDESNWQKNIPLTRDLGNEWLAARTSALARVPSAILPFTFNYLLNPAHSSASSIRILESHDFALDERLFGIYND